VQDAQVKIAYIGLGSNLDQPEAQVRRGFDEIAVIPQTQLLQRSKLYRCAPWGLTDQPDFINAAAQIQTKLEPRQLLEQLLAIERKCGRVRGGQRWGPRVLDLDLLLYADYVDTDSALQLPHPRVAERAFVLTPLADLAPQLLIPGFGSVSELLAKLNHNDCRVFDNA
jgi:2-amino-4-hydroxy-6-hydroxymethyldihydropteridine diphosphokinase